MTKQTNTQPVATAQLDWSEDGAPISSQFDDVYFSRHSGIDETRYVFLEQNKLPERFAALNNTEGATLHIGETGFGTGLNFLCAWQLRDQLAADCRLQFTSVEKYPLSLEHLTKALQAWPELADYVERLLEQYPPLTPGWHYLSFLEEKVDLNLFIGDVLDGFGSQRGPVDAWFLDGFAPAKNPEMWTAELFSELVRLGQPSTTLSTFTAASAVREGLKDAGFSITRVKGYGRKRHMLTGCLAELPEQPQTVITTPWFILPTHTTPEKKAVVIGAGLAGSATAFSLARRGWQVDVLDRHSQPAQEASGNQQGILYTKLSAETSQKSDFYTRAYLYATQQLPQLLSAEAHEWQNCGVLQLANTAKEAARQQLFLENCPQPEALIKAVDASQASQLAGLEIAQPGLFFPAAGWAVPGALCRRYLDHDNIRFRGNTNVNQLRYQDNQWQLLDAQEQIIAQAGTLIIASAFDALSFDVSSFLPLKRIRGQVSHIPVSQESPLNTVICGNTYISPALNQHFHVGASFNLNMDNTELRAEDHQHNLEQTTELVPALAKQQNWSSLNTTTLEGRVGFRCASPDYLPLVGPLPDRSRFIDQYAKLRKDATLHFTTPGSYAPGLYLNVGHGSKGLVSCPLSGELLAAQICNETLPIEKNLVDAVNPSRFLIRDLIRQKI